MDVEALGTPVLDVSESFGGTAGGAYDYFIKRSLYSGMDLVTAQEYVPIAITGNYC